MHGIGMVIGCSFEKKSEKLRQRHTTTHLYGGVHLMHTIKSDIFIFFTESLLIIFDSEHFSWRATFDSFNQVIAQFLKQCNLTQIEPNSIEILQTHTLLPKRMQLNCIKKYNST